MLNRKLDQGVPVFACLGREQDAEGAGNLHIDAFERHLEHQAREAAVGDENIAAAAKNKKRDAAAARPLEGFDDLVLGARAHKPARRAANPQGGEGGEQLVLFQLHLFKATSSVQVQS